MAAEDPELSAIASANYALASFEAGDTDGAMRSARQLLRRFATPRNCHVTNFNAAHRAAQASSPCESGFRSMCSSAQ